MATPMPSPGLTKLLDLVGPIKQQIELALQKHTPEDDVQTRLQEDYGRGYLYGAIEFLREPLHIQIPPYEYITLYLHLIGDPETVCAIVEKRMLDLRHKSCAKAAREAHADMKTPAELGGPKRLANFLRTGKPSTPPPRRPLRKR